MFKFDSPFSSFLNRIADIMLLGALFVIACIPIITAGAALTAAYYISFKMAKNEEAYIVRGFFKAFKENFKQALLLWIFVLVLAGAVAADYRIILYSGIGFKSLAKIIMNTAVAFAAVGTVFIFPMQARFENSVKNTIKNAFLLAYAHLPSALILILISAVPLVVIYFVPWLAPLALLLGFGGVFYLQSFVILRVFRKYEPKEEEDAQE